LVGAGVLVSGVVALGSGVGLGCDVADGDGVALGEMVLVGDAEGPSVGLPAGNAAVAPLDAPRAAICDP